MKPIYVIQYPFYSWTTPQGMVEEILAQTAELNYLSNVANQTSQGSLDYPPFIHFANSCLAELKNHLYSDAAENFSITVTDCWINKTQYAKRHHRHRHSNSVYSGILYLTESSTPTRFYHPNPYFYLDPYIRPAGSLSPSSLSSFDLMPTQGELVIFPSNLEHEVLGNKEKKTRYTLSFNSFYRGEIGLAIDKASVNIA